MTPSERKQMESLDRYWDELPRGAAEHPHEMDPVLVDTVRDLRALHRPPAIDPAFQHRLEEELLAGPAAASPWPGQWRLHPSGPVSPPSLNGHAPSGAWIPPSTKPNRQRWQPFQLAAAAVLALALIGSLLVLRFAGREPEHAQSVLDAASRPTVDTLLDAEMQNAAADWTPLVVQRWTFQPGNATLSVAPLDGPQWIVAERGTLLATVGGDQRKLGEGHALVVPANQTLRVRNPGSAAATAVRGVAAVGFAFEDYPREAISKQNALETEAQEALPPGPSRVIFERLTLLAGSTLVLEPTSGQDWLDVTSGALGLTLLGDGLPPNWHSGREREISADEALPALVPGTRVTLRNLGEDSLVLLRLRVLPIDAGEGSE
jgi:hypothetical protein